MQAFWKIRGVFVEHPYTQMNFPERLDQERLKELVAKIKNGVIVPNEIEELAKGHVRLAMRIASELAAKNNLDIAIAEALFGVAYAIKHAKDRLIDDNITGYIAACAQSFAANSWYDSIVSGRTLRHKKMKTPVKEPLQDVATLPDHLFELWDSIQSCISNDFENAVINLRAQGFNDREIGDKLSCSRMLVNQTRNEIFKRFQKEG